MNLNNWMPIPAELDVFFEKLYDIHLNSPINVTAIKNKEDFMLKHVLDSILLFSKKDLVGETLADIGSGGGFPGIVLAAWFPEKKITLIESIGKKCAFLESTAKTLGLSNVEVINARAEDVQGRTFDIITARGVSKVREMLKFTGHMAAETCTWVFYKGEHLDEELKQASKIIGKKGLKVENVRFEEPITRTYCLLTR